MKLIHRKDYLKENLFDEKEKRFVSYVSQQNSDKSPHLIKARHYLLVDYFNSLLNKQKQIKQRKTLSKFIQKQESKMRQSVKRQHLNQYCRIVDSEKFAQDEQNKLSRMRYDQEDKQIYMFPKLQEGVWSQQFTKKCIKRSIFLPHKSLKQKNIKQYNQLFILKRNKKYSIDTSTNVSKNISPNKTVNFIQNYGQLPIRKRISNLYDSLRTVSQQKNFNCYRPNQTKSKVNRFMIKRPAIDLCPYDYITKKVSKQSRDQQKTFFSAINSQTINLFSRRADHKKMFIAKKQDSFFDKYCPWEDNEQCGEQEIKQEAL